MKGRKVKINEIKSHRIKQVIQNIAILALALFAFTVQATAQSADQATQKIKNNEIKAQEIKTLDQLLNVVKKEQTHLSEENSKREAKFISKRDQQKKLLAQAQAELKKEERTTVQLTKEFEAQEKLLSKLETELQVTLGALGELFGVVRQVAGDMKGQFQTSVVSAQISGRDNFMGKIAERKELPSIIELEKLWFEIQKEMTESGKVVQFQREVVNNEGEREARKVTRIGSFNLVSDGVYLNYQSETNQVTELARQPSGRFLSLIDDLEATNEAFIPFAVDPSRGAILSMLVQAPSFTERIQQGGIVGYVILILLMIGLGLSVERWLVLRKEEAAIKDQLESDIPSLDNPLGHIMDAFEKNKNEDIETLEIRLDEAIMKNTPNLEKGIGTIKILAAVAPLLGLLGTVTGMIMTFQSITLFGTGDPKLMAGGISQALITTVLGLVCAIPLLLAHNFVSGKSKHLLQTLEEESVGLIAEKTRMKS